MPSIAKIKKTEEFLESLPLDKQAIVTDLLVESDEERYGELLLSIKKDIETNNYNIFQPIRSNYV